MASSSDRLSPATRPARRAADTAVPSRPSCAHSYLTAHLAASHARLWPVVLFVAALLFLILDAYLPGLVLPLALLLFLLGIPHGAVERRPEGPYRAVRPTLTYTALYLVFGQLVFASWLLHPPATLVVFLALSAWHFARAEDNPAIGLWVVTGSLLFMPAETLNIFALLVGESAAPASWTGPARYLAAAVGVWVIAGAIWTRRPLAETVVVLVVFAVVPPIPAVACYFFITHALREMAHTLDSVDSRPRTAARLYLPAALPAMTGGVLGVAAVAAGYLPLFFAAGLAVAFIVPHMLPVERLSIGPDPRNQV